MATVSVIYAREAGATFDFEYYDSVHLPLVRKHWTSAGLKRLEAFRGLPASDGQPSPYIAIAMLTFASADHVSAALGGEHTAEILADLANFTSVQPVIQVNEDIG